MRRRDLLTLAGAAGVGAAAAPFASPPARAVAPMDAPFAPLDVSPSRVVRTVVGLRPYRPSGFVVRAERLGWRKTLVHNYGHGGCGVTLSWGSAALAVETAIRATDARRYAVLGCGVIGLTTALLLLRAGREVTLYADAMPPDTTSNVAAAIWGPFTLFQRSKVNDAFIEQYRRVVAESHRAFQHFVNDPAYGVRWVRDVSLLNAPADPDDIDEDDRRYRTGLRADESAAARFGVPGALSYYAMLIDTDIYLRALMRDVENAGGRIVRRRFESDDDVARLYETAIVNCTGLGAGALFGDDEIEPVRGQLTLLLPQPDIDYGYGTRTETGELLYMYPRPSAIVLGGTTEFGEGSTEVDPLERARVLAGHADIAARVRAGGAPPAPTPEPTPPPVDP